MKKHILTGAILSLLFISATAYAQGSTVIHIGAQFHFKKHDLIKIHDRYFTLERDALGMESYEMSDAENEHILIVH